LLRRKQTSAPEPTAESTPTPSPAPPTEPTSELQSPTPPSPATAAVAHGTGGRFFYCANTEATGSTGFHWVSCVLDIGVSAGLQQAAPVVDSDSDDDGL
jgi:hypothetical protein